MLRLPLLKTLPQPKEDQPNILVATARAETKHLAAEIYLQVIGKRVGGRRAKVESVGLAIGHALVTHAHKHQRIANIYTKITGKRLP